MKINAKTKIVGLFGYPIHHSFSPIFHNAAFAGLELDFIYLPFSVKPADLKEAVQAIKSLNITGINVTIPHKEKILPYLDEISPEAKMIKAVNTVHNKKGKLIGYNTDGEGFIQSLRKEGKFNPEGKSVFMVGAGGAAYAISFALIRAGVKKFTFTNRIFDFERARVLFKHLKNTFKDRCELSLIDFDKRNSRQILGKVDLFVNATSVGMHSSDDQLLIDLDFFSPDVFIYDVVYNRKTNLLREAEERKLSSLGGLEMLLYQGALSFEIWTHRKAPIETMREALKQGGVG